MFRNSKNDFDDRGPLGHVPPNIKSHFKLSHCLEPVDPSSVIERINQSIIASQPSQGFSFLIWHQEALIWEDKSQLEPL